MVACLEGPVCEEYTNAKNSVGNPLYPIMPAFQYLLNDNFHALMFEGMDGGNKISTTSVFLPIPIQSPMSPRSFNIHLLWPAMIDESSVEFVDQRHEDNTDTKQHDNHSPTPINIPLCTQDLGICLVHASDDKSKIIGYQLF